MTLMMAEMAAKAASKPEPPVGSGATGAGVGGTTGTTGAGVGGTTGAGASQLAGGASDNSQIPFWIKSK